MNAHSESKRAFLLLGLAECVAPTQEWPLTVSPTDGQPWDNADMHPRSGSGIFLKIRGELQFDSSSAQDAGRGANPLCAGTCSGRNVPESNLARSDTQRHRSVRRSVARRRAPSPARSLWRGYKTYTQRFPYGRTDGCTQLSTALSPVFVTLPNTEKGPRTRIHVHSDPRPASAGLTRSACNTNICSDPTAAPLISPFKCPCSQSLSRTKIHE